MQALYRVRHGAFAESMALPGYTGSPGDRPKPPVLHVRYEGPYTESGSHRRVRQSPGVRAQQAMIEELHRAALMEDMAVRYLGFDVSGYGTRDGQ
jgi:hypothetical protein